MSSLRSAHDEGTAMLQRMRGHNYCVPALYLLTLRKGALTPVLSAIGGTPSAPEVLLSAAGRAVDNALVEWSVRYPQIRVYERAIMPDHLHIAVKVEKMLPGGLSRAVAWLMGAATRGFGLDNSFFAKGFNDKIAFTNLIFERQILYVRDNPRRLLIKRLYADFYRRRWTLKIDDEVVCALGNIHLLRAPEILQVRFSRKFAHEVFESYLGRWKRAVENGGTLVSPFIHPREREMLRLASEQGGNYIRICENGFSERFAPSGREFDLMAEGRLLLIAPKVHDTRKQTMTYTHAQQMNALAAKIAEGASRLLIVERTK